MRAQAAVGGSGRPGGIGCRRLRNYYQEARVAELGSSIRDAHAVRLPALRSAVGDAVTP